MNKRQRKKRAKKLRGRWPAYWYTPEEQERFIYGRQLKDRSQWNDHIYGPFLNLGAIDYDVVEKRTRRRIASQYYSKPSQKARTRITKKTLPLNNNNLRTHPK